MAKADSRAARRARQTAAAKASASSRLPRPGWSEWVALILAALYLYAHFSMVPASLSEWAGLANALLFGR